MQYLRWSFFILFAALMQACNLSQYNSSDPDVVTDRRAGDTYIYGDPDGEPRQSLVQYDDPADAPKRTRAIREKLYTPQSPSEFYRHQLYLRQSDSEEESNTPSTQQENTDQQS